MFDPTTILAVPRKALYVALRLLPAVGAPPCGEPNNLLRKGSVDSMRDHELTSPIWERAS